MAKVATCKMSHRRAPVKHDHRRDNRHANCYGEGWNGDPPMILGALIVFGVAMQLIDRHLPEA